ncbi:hypothetical protein [Geodermatophilus sp. URMC 62]|uniref:hypothetical protein n=1 Tax=Geodermatophilus sp. URMC 62 TaxID=3423414 RepID=UPI00406BF685
MSIMNRAEYRLRLAATIAVGIVFVLIGVVLDATDKDAGWLFIAAMVIAIGVIPEAVVRLRRRSS